VDHLTEQKNALIAVLFQSAITDFNSVFYAIAKAEVPCEKKNNRAEIKNGRGKILFTMVL
jgi:hypothetical protein